MRRKTISVKELLMRKGDPAVVGSVGPRVGEHLLRRVVGGPRMGEHPLRRVVGGPRVGEHPLRRVA